METGKRATHARARPPKAEPRARRSQLDLTVQYATAAKGLPTRDAFCTWARSALEHDAQITVRLVGTREGRDLNRTYRGRDYATNVLTFVLSDTPPYAGDFALCAPVIAREARTQHKDLTAHYAHLTVHAVLHLQGYDHQNDAEAAAMEQREKRILRRLGYPDPYALPDHHG